MGSNEADHTSPVHANPPENRGDGPAASGVKSAVLDIIKIPEVSVTRFVYSLSTSAIQADLPIALRVEVGVRTGLLDAFCTAIQDSVEGESDHRLRLRQTGQMLYRLLFPADSQEASLLSSRLADWRDPLVISTNDADIPWELLHDGREYLGVRLALGRQMVTSTLFQEGRPIGEIRRALIVSNPTGDLPSAEAEADRLARFFQARDIACRTLTCGEADLVTVLRELAAGYDIFHYSGHVGADESGRTGLRLHDHYLLDEEIRHGLATAPGADSHVPPVVFVNGCHSAPQLSSVCGAFLNSGSRIVVGARYGIVDEPARVFAERYYSGLLKGMTAGVALQETRSSLSNDPTGTWAAFVLFGQPATQLWNARPTGNTSPEPPAFRGPFWEEFGAKLEPAAAATVRKILDTAQPFGLVTSFHLASGLVSANTILTAAVDASGIDRSTITDMLEMFAAQDDIRGPITTTEPVEITQSEEGRPEPGVVAAPRPSDNALGILTRAVDIAHDDDRDIVTLDDLADAFVQTGGGVVGEFLTHVGVELAVPDTPFVQSGAFRARQVQPETQRALQCARLLSSTKGEIVGSYALVMGLALARSAVLREALLDQGPVGERAVGVLFPEIFHLTVSDFSPRARQAMQAAFDAPRVSGGQAIDDTALLLGALADENGTASQLLHGWGIDAGRLRASLLTAGSSRGDQPAGAGTARGAIRSSGDRRHPYMEGR